MCSAASLVILQLAECVLPPPGSIPGSAERVLKSSQAAKHHFLPFFPKSVTGRTYVRTNELTNGKKIRLLKYPYTVNAQDLKMASVLNREFFKGCELCIA